MSRRNRRPPGPRWQHPNPNRVRRREAQNALGQRSGPDVAGHSQAPSETPQRGSPPARDLTSQQVADVGFRLSCLDRDLAELTELTLSIAAVLSAYRAQLAAIIPGDTPHG